MLYITYRDHLTVALFWISYICVYVYVRVYLCLMDLCDLFFIIIFIFIIINHVMSLKQKCLFPIKNLAPGCCLEFALFSSNFSLVLLLKVLLIKKGILIMKFFCYYFMCKYKFYLFVNLKDLLVHKQWKNINI